MKNRIFNTLFILLCLTALTLTLASCSASGKNDYAEDMMGDGYYDGNYGNSGAVTDEAAPPDSSNDLEEDQVSSTIDRKLIRRISLHLQTKDFDSLITTIESGIKAYEGYVESSEIRGDSVDTAYNRTKYARIVARIPSADADAFIESFTSENTNVLTREENCEDVTLNYVDTESRLGSLRAQRAALEELYEKADSVNEIAYVQKELSAVISEIEAYESKLRELESLVSYTTITLDINEVKEYTEPEEKTFTEEIKEGFKEALSDVGVFYRELTIFTVTSLPYLLILAFFALFPVTTLIVILIIIRSIRRKRAKKQSSSK